MTKPLLFSLSAAPGLTEQLGASGEVDFGEIERRRFPDGEAYVRLLATVAGRDVLFLCSLERPDEKTLPLLFAAAAARSQGARRIGLIAPYLAYMRQDREFLPGEAVTSHSYAALLSAHFDWLVTVDPHLHRHPSLGAVYSIPAVAISAAEPMARWIEANVDRPLLIGPDEESRQWVARIANLIGAPFVVFRKTRKGDREVSLSADHVELAGRTAVVVDDIVSTAGTMAEAVHTLCRQSGAAPVCVAVHALFGEDALERLTTAGASRIVSANTIGHETNAIDVGAEIVAAVQAWSAQ